jgi:hypothetical protein
MYTVHELIASLLVGRAQGKAGLHDGGRHEAMSQGYFFKPQRVHTADSEQYGPIRLRSSKQLGIQIHLPEHPDQRRAYEEAVRGQARL